MSDPDDGTDRMFVTWKVRSGVGVWGVADLTPPGVQNGSLNLYRRSDGSLLSNLRNWGPELLNDGEAGLTQVALHPNFAQHPKARGVAASLPLSCA